MQQAELTIGGIPAVLYGGQGSGVYLYVHGKHGRKEEAAALADIVCPKGWQVLGIDLPCDSAQTEGDELVPWQVVPALRAVMDYVRGRWTRVALYAVSIGAWFSLLAFADARLENCLLVAPIVDMARLIEGRMAAAGVCADELRARGTIETASGQALSWRYYSYTQAHPVTQWPHPTAILYPGQDELTDRDTVASFAGCFGCEVTVLEDGAHWLHTDEQLAFLRAWSEAHTAPADAVEVVAALIWQDGRLLACQRPAHKARGLLWEFVGGKVEPGESREQALARECREELDVEVEARDVFMDVTHTYPDLTVHLTLFNAVITAGTPQRLEHHDIRWLRVDELDDYPFCPADKDILERLKQNDTPYYEG